MRCDFVASVIPVTNHATSFSAKNVQKTALEAAEMIFVPWNQQNILTLQTTIFPDVVHPEFSYLVEIVPSNVVHVEVKLFGCTNVFVAAASHIYNTWMLRIIDTQPVD